MKKKIIICFCFCFSLLLLIAIQLYSIYSFDGNLVFSIWNESRKKGDIEIYVDGNKTITLKEGSGIYYSHSIFVSPKNHTVVIKFNDYVSKDIKFNSFFFTIIRVSIQTDRYNNTPNEVHYEIKIQKWPQLLLL